jgi:VWFA-related protein
VRTIAAAATAAFLFCSTSAAISEQQQPAAPGSQPTFRTGVDLLTLQARVLDASGRPVTDLGPADFSVTIEGKPRTVLFAKFRGTTAAAAVPPPAGPAAAAASHADNTATSGGRLVMFVVDRDSIKSGSEKALLESAGAIMDALTPADAVGLLSIPTGGVDPTRDHARVRDELKRLSGTQPQAIGGVRERNLTYDEALAYERSDAITIKRVVERECSIGEGSRCAEDLQVEARNLLFAARGHARTVLQALGSTLKAIAPVRGAKHVVLISGGQAFDQELLTHYNEFARDAAAAQVMVNAVHVDQPESGAGDRAVVSSGFGGRDMASGLTTMTGMTGGGYYAGVGTATGVFERIKTEIASDYELGLETLPGDAGGKLQDVAVKVSRPGANVRARKQILIAGTTAAPADRILALLAQPTDIADLPIQFASYTTRGQEPATLRVLLSAEIGGTQSGATSEWAFAIFDRNLRSEQSHRRWTAGAHGGHVPADRDHIAAAGAGALPHPRRGDRAGRAQRRHRRAAARRAAGRRRAATERPHCRHVDERADAAPEPDRAGTAARGAARNTVFRRRGAREDPHRHGSSTCCGRRPGAAAADGIAERRL